MADASRFPRLAPPFAIVGAAAGWLSAGLLGNPMVLLLRHEMQIPTTLVACGFAAATGALLRHWCAGRRYGYQLAIPDPSVRLPTDAAWRHALVMTMAGTLTGALIGGIFGADESLRGAIAGTACALVFLPVGFSVLSAARRAQRARLGSIVAASDRRAVWGILAALLGVTTFEAVPDWASYVENPLVAALLLFASCVVVTSITIVDARAYRALSGVVRDLEARPEPLEAPEKIDLGVGDDLSARLERSTSPYRGSERALALVHGNPVVARTALKRALIRGVVSLGLLACVTALHVGATTRWARTLAMQIAQPRCCNACCTHSCWD